MKIIVVVIKYINFKCVTSTISRLKVSLQGHIYDISQLLVFILCIIFYYIQFKIGVHLYCHFITFQNKSEKLN
jgi:hypothetical protein